MKKILFLLVGATFSIGCNGQQNTISTGGDASGSGGSLSYSIGQIDYFNASGTNGSTNEGVQQPYEFFNTSGIKEQSQLITAVHPNPSIDIIHITVRELKGEMKYIIYDQSGKIVNNGVIDTYETEINLEGLASGEYHFTLFNEKQQLESLKIIKH